MYSSETGDVPKVGQVGFSGGFGLVWAVLGLSRRDQPPIHRWLFWQTPLSILVDAADGIDDSERIKSQGRAAVGTEALLAQPNATAAIRAASLDREFTMSKIKVER